MVDTSKILCIVIVFRVKCLFLVYPMRTFVGSNLFYFVCKIQFLSQPTFRLHKIVPQNFIEFFPQLQFSLKVQIYHAL